MNIKVNFVGKLPKAMSVNEIIFVKDKKIKKVILNSILSSILENKLFHDQLFLQKEYKNVNYIFINCKKLKTSYDYESIGSKLFEYLKKNKIESSYIDSNINYLNNIQLEKVIHGFKLKSYNFNIYKTNNKKNNNINLNIVGNLKAKSNTLRKKLDALLDGVFFYKRFSF